MSKVGLPLDVEAMVRALPVDVPGVGRITLGEMTAEDHERYHAALARDVVARMERIATPPRASRRTPVAGSHGAP